MQGKKQKKNSWLTWVEISVASVLIVVLTYLLLPLLAHPTPFMDEGYYLGATHSILKGDLLLHHYAFDKPFLLAWMPLPGVLLFGENPIGFHVMPVIFSLFGMVLFFFALQGATFSQTVRQTILNGTFSLFLFTLPVLRSLEVSNFCEPYLLFFGSLILYGLTNRTSRFKDSTLAKIFVCGLFVKFSFALWAPVLGFADYVTEKKPWPRGYRDWIQSLCTETLRWLKHARVFLIIGLLITAWNAVPFSAILWFSGMGGKGTPKFDGFFGPLLNLGDRFFQWFTILVSSLGEAFFTFSIVILAFLALNRFRKHNLNGWLLLALLSTAIHFFAFPITGVQVLSRYIVQFLPLFVFLVALIAARVGVWRLGVFALMILFCFMSFRQVAGAVGGDVGLGREAYVLREDLDRSSVVLSNDSLWVTEAFHDHLINSGCLSKSCLDGFAAGVALQRNHFLLKEGSLWRVMPRAISSSHSHVKTEFLPLSLSALAESVLKKLKIHKAVTLDRIMETEMSGVVSQVFEGHEVRRLYDGSTFRLKAVVARGVPAFIEVGEEVEVEFVIGFNDIREYPREFNQPRTSLMARVLRFHIGGKDVTDLVMPLFHKGYSFPIAVLERPWSSGEILFGPVLTQKGTEEGIAYSIFSSRAWVNHEN